MYKAGASVKLEGNMAFTSVNKLDLEITTSTGQAVFGDDGLSEGIMLDGLNQ